MNILQTTWLVLNYDALLKMNLPKVNNVVYRISILSNYIKMMHQ